MPETAAGRETRYAAHRIEEAADDWWEITDDGEAIGMAAGHAAASVIVTALNRETPAEARALGRAEARQAVVEVRDGQRNVDRETHAYGEAGFYQATTQILAAIDNLETP